MVSVGAEMVLMLLSSALSSELELAGHKPECPTFSSLICQILSPQSLEAKTSSDVVHISTHSVSALVINDIHKNCDWAGKLWMGLCTRSNLIRYFSLCRGWRETQRQKQKVEGNLEIPSH